MRTDCRFKILVSLPNFVILLSGGGNWIFKAKTVSVLVALDVIWQLCLSARMSCEYKHGV
jgi:hypothetical protein